MSCEIVFSGSQPANAVPPIQNEMDSFGQSELQSNIVPVSLATLASEMSSKKGLSNIYC